MKKLCEMCPRKCNVDRNLNEGFCGQKNEMMIAKSMLHYWEEPIISGTSETKKNGSGAIFFCGCNLKCVYCQNFEISHCVDGKIISPENLVELFKSFEKQNAVNINLVTPTHFSNQILEALKIYKPKIPVVWNTSGYENEQTLDKLKGYVDIFLTDFKYYDEDLSQKFSNCKDYFLVASKALKKMRKICPIDYVDNGLMKSGIIVRHLVLPKHSDDSIKVLQFVHDTLGKYAYISLMSQFTPIVKDCQFAELNEQINPIEYKRVVHKLYELGFENGFTQEISSANEKFIPEFKRK